MVRRFMLISPLNDCALKRAAGYDILLLLNQADYLRSAILITAVFP